MILRLVIWALAGGAIGGIVGYMGKCAGGACPLTCNPVGGILVGALLGVVFAGGSSRDTGVATAGSASAEDLDRAMGSGKVVLVDFYATWCGPCKRIKPVIDEIEQQYSNSVEVVRVDVDSQRELAKNYDVSSIPDVRIYANGEVIERFVGLRRKKEYVQAIRNAFEKLKTEDSEKKTEGQDV